MKTNFGLIALVLVLLLGGGVWWLSSTKPDSVAEESGDVQVPSSPLAETAKDQTRPVIVRRPRGAGDPGVVDESSRFKTVWDLIADKRKEDAIQLLREMVKKNPNDDEAMAELGVILAGDAATAREAREVLERALAVNPSNDKALGDLLYMKSDDATRGDLLGKLRALQERNPDSSNLAAGVGRLLAENGDYAGAVAQWQRASTDPKFAEAGLSGLIEAYQRTGETDKSLDAYARLIAAQEQKAAQYAKEGDMPKGFESRILGNKLGLASALIAAGEFDRAETLLREVSDRDPKNEAVTSLWQLLSRRRAG